MPKVEIELESEVRLALVYAGRTDLTHKVVGENDLETLPNGKLHVKGVRPMVRGMRYWLKKPRTIIIATTEDADV
jgi:hypothetical protein